MVAFQLGARLQLEFAHADQILRDLGQPLLALVRQKLGPELQMLIDLLQRLGIIARQLHALPQLARKVGSLNGFHKQVAATLLLADGGVAAISQRAARPIAEAGDIVGVSTERRVLSNPAG